MKTESEQVLSMLIDGEAVEPDSLAAALAEPDAAAILVEYAAVHRAIAADNERPSERFYQAIQSQLAARRRRAIGWHMPLATAALVVVSALGGAWLGASWHSAPAALVVPAATGNRAFEATASPVRANTTPLQVGVGSGEPPGCGGERAPKPDRSLTFTPGVDWHAGVPQRGNKP
jgi:hypothetical protein